MQQFITSKARSKLNRTLSCYSFIWYLSIFFMLRNRFYSRSSLCSNITCCKSFNDLYKLENCWKIDGSVIA